MKNISIYTILSYILVPFAAILGFVSLIAIFIALANPAMLLPLFMMVAVVIYTICSLIFLQKGIKHAKPCKTSLKDWIKVNAYVAIVFSTLMLVDSVGLIANPVLLKDGLEKALILQKTSLPPQITFAMMLKVMKAILYGMAFFSAILTMHIFLSFRLIKIYNYVFDSE
jgi:hypothetical protein